MNDPNNSTPVATPGEAPASAAVRLFDIDPSSRGFTVDLYREHLEEAGFLYEQWLSLPEDPEMFWQDLADFEERQEAHLDALVLGGDLALRVCEQQARDGDFGEQHAAVRLFCRHRRRDLVQQVIDALDTDDEEQVQAIADALKWDLPQAWVGDMVQWLAVQDVRSDIAVRIAAYQRMACGADLLQYLPRWKPEVQAVAIQALGRLPYPSARAPLHETYLQQGDDAVKAAAVVALLRMGEQQGLSYCASLAHRQPWALVPLGLGGGRSHATQLLSSASTGYPAGLHALGLLGDATAIPVLLNALTDEVQAEAAAMALNLITGAALYEETFVPDEIDEEVLFEDEVEQLQRGEPLVPPGEDPLGMTIVCLSQSQPRWAAWWAQHQGAFRAGIRYRNGKPYTPMALIDNLNNPLSPDPVRCWAAAELAIRYGWQGHFETDMPVPQQQQILAEMNAWVQARAASWSEGKWYFAGHMLY